MILQVMLYVKSENSCLNRHLRRVIDTPPHFLVANEMSISGEISVGLSLVLLPSNYII